MGVPARKDTGIRVPVSAPTSETGAVLVDIVLERHRQIHLHGHNEDTLDGTGPEMQWAVVIGNATQAERIIREKYDGKVQAGQPLTWVDFLLEEMAEAFCEDDPAKLYTELSQVAAVAVSWMEKIRQR